MRKWLRRIRGTVGMGLAWAVPWGAAGVLFGLIVDPDGSMDEPWVAIGAYPGFLGGVVFSAVLAIAARQRRIDELSLSRFAIWGALAGVLVGVLPFTFGTPAPGLPRWFAGVVIGSITLLSAASAAGSLALARRAEKRELLGAGADMGAVGRSERRKQDVPVQRS